MPFSPNRPIRVLYDGSHWWRCLKIKYHNFCHIREYYCWFVFDTPPPLPPMPWAMFIALAHWLNLSAVPCDGLETSKKNDCNFSINSHTAFVLVCWPSAKVYYCFIALSCGVSGQQLSRASSSSQHTKHVSEYADAEKHIKTGQMEIVEL